MAIQVSDLAAQCAVYAIGWLFLAVLKVSQVHVAHSSLIMGVGIFAGPPYWCAQANVEVSRFFF